MNARKKTVTAGSGSASASPRKCRPKNLTASCVKSIRGPGTLESGKSCDHGPISACLRECRTRENVRSSAVGYQSFHPPIT